MDKLFVVVTGSSSGLGLEISKILLESGSHSVIGLDINKSDIQNSDFHFIKSDLSNRTNVNKLVEEIGKLTHNSLYGIVNVAGISVGKSIVGMNDDDWDKMIEVNLTAPALLISKLQDSMMDGGRIVNVSSPVSVTGSNKAIQHQRQVCMD